MSKVLDHPVQAIVGEGAPTPPGRPAWVEVNVAQLRRNFQAILRDKPDGLRILSVVKDDAYGHGIGPVAQAAIDSGVSCLAVITVEEGVWLRCNGVTAPILCMGERLLSELPCCVHYDLACCVSDLPAALALNEAAGRAGKMAFAHVKVNTGMNRYGVCWKEARGLASSLARLEHLVLEGIMSHFSMSDELDKGFAMLQLRRFQNTLESLAREGIRIPFRHLCNSGGFLDLPEAHFDMVRMGILPLGVYPSKVCRRIPGIEPVMSVKSRIAALQTLEKGDCVGYGMRYAAPGARRIAVVPIGYGDGFPRLVNQGHLLVHGRRAPLAGSVSMDALTIDVTDIPETVLWDEVVVMGRQGAEEVSAHDLARWKGSVSYDILTAWRSRLPRFHLGNSDPE